MKAAKNYPPLSLSVNAIADGRFLVAGEVLDQPTIAKLPASIKRYIVPAESSDDPEVQEVANFQLGQSYAVDRDDRLRQRSVQRQASEQFAAAQFQDAVEAQLAHEIENPDEATKAALEIAADNNQAAVGLEMAQLEYQAKQREMDEEAARQSVEEDPMLTDDNLHEKQILKQPADWKPQPKRMRKRYVCRNGTWLRTKNLKHFRPAEKIYVRNGVNDFEQIGVVTNGRLPAAYLED